MSRIRFNLRIGTDYEPEVLFYEGTLPSAIHSVQPAFSEMRLLVCTCGSDPDVSGHLGARMRASVEEGEGRAVKCRVEDWGWLGELPAQKGSRE